MRHMSAVVFGYFVMTELVPAMDTLCRDYMSSDSTELKWRMLVNTI